jgi:hypothetical protein
MLRNWTPVRIRHRADKTVFGDKSDSQVLRKGWTNMTDLGTVGKGNV